MEERTLTSPTRIKTRPDSCRNGSRAPKDGPVVSVRFCPRVQKNSQLSKLGKTQHSGQLDPPNPARMVVPELSRRTKNTSGHSVAVGNSASTGQSASTGHLAVTGQHQVPSPVSPLAKNTSNTQVDHTSPVVVTVPSTNMVTSLTSSAAKSHDLSSSHHAQPPSKKPPLGSFVSFPAQPQHLDPTRQRMLERANKARLYFLRQSGPNKFLIGGDSYDSRFHVNIGPQTCSCNKAHCIHLLFVMLRVLKVKHSSAMLWSKQLRNYEVESLLGDFRTRVSQRTATPRKSRRKFNFLRVSPDPLSAGSGTNSGQPSPGGSHDELSPPSSPGKVDQVHLKRSPSSNSLVEGVKVMDDGGGEKEHQQESVGADSDKEEDICPICLNELDEGEDLLICPCCSNHLHQHCMDIWAMEEKMKNEQVHCPVCRALWPYTLTSPSGQYIPDIMPVSVPVGGVGVIDAKAMTAGGGGTGMMTLSPDKAILLGSLREVFSGLSSAAHIDSLFSSDWKARETALSFISREAISLLLPCMNFSRDNSLSDCRLDFFTEPKTVLPRHNIHQIQRVCMEVVRFSCGDSVLKVFLAALDLLKVVLGYSLCQSQHDCKNLQDLIRPVVAFLLTRCADAQKRVKECSIEATSNLCLGQEGPLSVGSARGTLNSLPVTDMRFVLQVALSGQDKSDNNWQWWLGRLTFMDRTLSTFSHEFLLSQCVLRSGCGTSPNSDATYSEDDDPNFGSGMPSPSDSISSNVTPANMSENTYGSEFGPSLELKSFHPPQESTEHQGGTESNLSPPSLKSLSLSNSIQEGSSPSWIHAAVEENLLMQMWFFAARSTHIPQQKLGRVARRLIIRITKLLRDDPSSLEVVHTVVSLCHRTQAEGLLDRVLHARESTTHMSTSSINVGSMVAKLNGSSFDNEKVGQMLDMEAKQMAGEGRRKRKVGNTGRGRSPLRTLSPCSALSKTAVSNCAAFSATASDDSIDLTKTPSSHDGTSSKISSPGGMFTSLDDMFLSQSKQLSNTKTLSTSTAALDHVTKVKKMSEAEELAMLTLSGSDDYLTPCPMGTGAWKTGNVFKRKISRQRSRGACKVVGSDDFVASDESFQSALSDFVDDIGVLIQGGEGEGDGSSSSHDSKWSEGHLKHSSNSSSGGSVGKGALSMGVSSGFPTKPGYKSSPMYMRQSTASSAFSSDSMDAEGSGSFNMCKHNIEMEEAEALAKVRSMEMHDIPHPSLSGLAPPTPEVLIHVQANGKGKDETDQATVLGKQYLEGINWVKGKLIGTGAFCSCFLARDMENGIMFAVKQVSFVRNTQSQEAEELIRLRDEVAMLGRINHPNIVRCLGATQHGGHINIFIEWMAGGCLDQLLHDFGCFGENVICNYARQITRGIVFLHENDIIHRDLKGGNILVDSTGQKLRIADFGAAARLATHTTASGEFQNMEGTVAFMAPEVVKGGTDESIGYGRKCDVWSIGCVLIQMATAKPPWIGTYDPKNKFQLIFKIGQATSPPPMPEFSNPALKDFAIRCLEVKPKERPSSIELLKHPLFTHL